MKMEFQEMKKLESEVKGLQSLMREVHRNQVELNRVLLNSNVYARPAARAGEQQALLERGATQNASEAVQVLKYPSSKAYNADTPPKGEKRKSNSQLQGSPQEQKTSNTPVTQTNQQQQGSPRGNTPSKNSTRNSSFIRNILNEDSRAGIAIIDLFLTVKMAKDNLLFLSQSNTEAFNMLHQLKTETAAVGKGYRNLLDDMQQLLGRMNETLTRTILLDIITEKTPNININWENAEEKLSEELGETSRGCQTPTTSLNSEAQADECEDGLGSNSHLQGATRKSGGQRKDESRTAGTSTVGSSGCLSCFVTSHKDALFHGLPDLSEASLKTFLGTLLRLQKGDQSVCEECRNSSRMCSGLEEKESEGNLSLSDSSFQMFCDICEILDGATGKDLESNAYPTDTGVGTDSGASAATGQRRLPMAEEPVEEYPGGPSCSQPAADPPPDCLSCRRKSSKREAAVETEFEEAAAYIVGPEPNARPSVSCMGDLTRAVPEKKNVSTLTTANSIPTTPNGILTYRKLSNEIRAKLKKIKSKKALKLERKKSGKSSTKHSPRVREGEGISTDTLGDTTDRYNKIRDLGDEYMSEDSYYNCDSDSEDISSHSGNEDMEEFVEIYKEKSRAIAADDASTHDSEPTGSVHDEVIAPLSEERALDVSTCDRSIALCDDLRGCPGPRELGAPKSLLGFLHKTTLKTIRALFFEIQKCYPANFVQEILPKTMIETPQVDPDDRSISLGPGENKQKRIVIEGSSTDFVIYIQVEMDGGSRIGSQDSLAENRASSLGTQTKMLNSENVAPEEEKEIPLELEEEDGQSVCDIWEECDGGRWGDAEGGEETLSGPEIERETQPVSRDLRAEVLGTLDKAIREAFVDKHWGVKQKKGKVTKGNMAMVMKQAVQQADVWYQQSSLERMLVLAGQDPSAVTAEAVTEVTSRPPELEKALQLIREVENDVADVKLSEAISILPRLEWELRKHLRGKIKNLEEREPGNDIADVSFFSSLDLWPEDEDSSEVGNRGASERMRNLLLMLTELEDAIKSSESAGYSGTLGQYDSSKVYKLLRLLIASIQGLEEDASVASLSQTLDIASQLDTAVREYDSIVRRRPLDYLCPDGGKSWRNAEGVERVPEKQHLKNVRKKVFQAVETEAIQLERRVERDFGRMGPLERENDEAMMFLEAFLQKTERRLAELNGLKSDILKLSSWISDMHDGLLEKIVQKRLRREAEIETGKRITQAQQADASRESTQPSSPKEMVVRETISGLLQALDRLKSRAREKNQLCKEILSPKFSERVRESGNSSRRSSRSSFTAKRTDTLTSSLKTFRKIGPSSLYLSWSSPEGSLKDLISGYEIYLNGKLNQKVRSSRRLQAVLYSVDFTKGIDLELYAIAEDHPKILLISQHYQEE